MCKIKLLTSEIRKSIVELPEGEMDRDSCSGKINVSLSVPKNIEEGKKLRCTVDFFLGEENNLPYIFIRLMVWFQIEQVDETENVEKKLEKHSMKQSLKIMEEKIQKLTELHNGKPLYISLLDKIED